MTNGEYVPKYLGKAVAGPIPEVELIPWSGEAISISLDCSEFTTLCPVTQQPDFGRMEISYIPDAHLIETKSLKLYLQGFRDYKGFNEQIVAHLAGKLFNRVKPKWMAVEAFYNRRGGIGVSCRCERGKKP